MLTIFRTHRKCTGRPLINDYLKRITSAKDYGNHPIQSEPLFVWYLGTIHGSQHFRFCQMPWLQ